MLNLGACQLLPENRYYYHKLFFVPVYIDMTANTNHSSTPNLRIAHRITFLGTLSKAFFEIHKAKGKGKLRKLVMAQCTNLG